MPQQKPLLRIRLVSVAAANDALLVGNRIILLAELSDFGYTDKWNCMSIKSKCHSDWFVTDATKADWEAYIAAQPTLETK